MEADEQFTATTAIKIDKDTGNILIQKDVSGAGNANTNIDISSP